MHMQRHASTNTTTLHHYVTHYVTHYAHALTTRRLYGPFRQMWTFPFEAFLFHLKQLCEGSNWKSVPFTVVRKWSLGRALTLASPVVHSFTSLDVLPQSDFMLGPVLRLACVTSPLLIALTSSRDHTHMHEARYLRFVCRDGVEVRSGEWLLLTSGKTQVIACVEEMAEVWLGGGELIRFWCTQCTPLTGVLEDTDGLIRIPRDTLNTAHAHSLLVRFEKVSVCQLFRRDRGGHYEFEYVL
jgi:hypothetical protein